MLQKTLAFIAALGARPDDGAEFNDRRRIAVFGAGGGILAQLVFSAVFFASGAQLAGLEVLIFALLMLLGLILFGVTRRHFYFYWLSWVLIGLISGPLGAVLAGNSLLDNSPVVWGFLAPLFAMVVGSPRQAVPWFVAFFLVAVGTIFLQAYLQIPNSLTLPARIGAAIFNLGGFLLFIFLTLYYFISQRDLAFRLLRGEQEKSEALLLNILPADIAAILKNDNRTIADYHEGASILFADVVNFTPMSAQMTPTELVELLNEIFSRFDALVEKYGLEKIKTIGDCYMVAGGVPRPRRDHAQALVRLALEMQAFVAGREFRGQAISFRIGVNSGPVVAGVIGRKKFIYDLWGDAVNTASRMESHGSGGAVQITRATHELIKDEFVCEPCGTVNVKGKGEMEIWHVNGSQE